MTQQRDGQMNFVSYAHGFIVGNTLISNAHVLNGPSGSKGWYCVQNGEIVPVSDLIISKPYLLDCGRLIGVEQPRA